VSFLGLLMLHHMVGGEWGFINRRIFEAGSMVAVVTMLLAIPLLVPKWGLGHLFEWSHHDLVANDAILREKAPYLNPTFFVVRVVIYYVFWLSYAFIMNRLSAQVDETGSPSYRTRVRFLSGPGILVYVLLFTFYQVDFLMSLEPHWTSTIFGLMNMVGAALSALSLAAILMWVFRDTQPLASVINQKRFWDVGNLMLALTLLWAYMAFSQYLISWAGNLPEESDFYQHRLAGGPYRALALVIVIFHFAVPFFLLLQRPAKRTGGALALVSLLLIVMRFVDILWIVKPSFAGTDAARLAPSDFGFPLAFAGIWLVAFTFFLRSKRLLPVWETHHDRPPIKSEVYTHG
jgi:hypothetical protein